MKIWTGIIEPWLKVDPIRMDLFWLLIVLVVSFILHKIVKLIMKTTVTKIAAKVSKRTKSQLDDYIFKYTRFERLALIVYVFGFSFLSLQLTQDGEASLIASAAEKLSGLIAIWIVVKLLHGALNGLASFTENDSKFKGKPYRSYIQVFVLLIYIIALLIAAGTISGESPWALVSGIGAMTAILLLVFRETILSFVASLQISSYDLVRKGDWISVPKYGADGDVTEVALHTIKIQNWDKTISVLPTNDLLQSGFKNWRGMQETGGRRIKRSLFIDVSSIKFLDEKMREEIGKINLLKPYFEEIEKTIHASYGQNSEHPLNDARLTNIGTFRVYITKYLQSLDSLRKDLTFLVRQLEPGPTGVPIEIYVFTSTTEWGKYENIQADIFDHLFAATREFDLKIFQYGANPLMKN